MCAVLRITGSDNDFDSVYNFSTTYQLAGIEKCQNFDINHVPSSTAINVDLIPLAF